MDFDDPFNWSHEFSRYMKYLRKKAIENHMILYIPSNLVEVDQAIYDNYISNKDVDDINE